MRPNENLESPHTTAATPSEDSKANTSSPTVVQGPNYPDRNVLLKFTRLSRSREGDGKNPSEIISGCGGAGGKSQEASPFERLGSVLHWSGQGGWDAAGPRSSRLQ